MIADDGAGAAFQLQHDIAGATDFAILWITTPAGAAGLGLAGDDAVDEVDVDIGVAGAGFDLAQPFDSIWMFGNEADGDSAFFKVADLAGGGTDFLDDDVVERVSRAGDAKILIGHNSSLHKKYSLWQNTNLIRKVLPSYISIIAHFCEKSNSFLQNCGKMQEKWGFWAKNNGF